MQTSRHSGDAEISFETQYYLLPLGGHLYLLLPLPQLIISSSPSYHHFFAPRLCLVFHFYCFENGEIVREQKYVHVKLHFGVF